MRIRHLIPAFWLGTLGMSAAVFGLPNSAFAATENESAAKKTTDAETYEKLQIFADIMAIIKDEYVEDVEDQALIDGALNGALSKLDPHSHYVAPVAFVEQQEATKREYGGLGIEVSSEGGLVKVNHAIEDGPAYEAGIKTGDFITAVDGEKVRNKPLDEAVKGMRGLAGDPVTVTVLSPGSLPRDVVVVRQVVRGRAVRHRVEKGVGYIYLETFNNSELTSDIERALKSLEAELGGTLPGLIIDMRGNRGGLLDQSVSVAGLFLDGGEVLSARGRDASDNQRYHAEPGELYPDMPIVVLVSPGSASAAEIVAGALQDRGRAVVIGRRSFGKGSVQSVIPLPNDGGALRLTTQRYYTPSGKSIQGRGIMPDMLVAAREDSGEIRKRFREDSLPNSLLNSDDTDYEENYGDILYPPETWPEDEDYQLRKAIDVIKTSNYQRLLDAQKTPLER
ncbi:S41 family peptidase [Litorimonas sp. RW-G-Af-16]|uniref:S41 family peptidase n=1 Tax=Litorimonas sp. RW-G-Af-16 TaxID=3241168 RepID=UPI00390C4508